MRPEQPADRRRCIHGTSSGTAPTRVSVPIACSCRIASRFRDSAALASALSGSSAWHRLFEFDYRQQFWRVPSDGALSCTCHQFKRRQSARATWTTRECNLLPQHNRRIMQRAERRKPDSNPIAETKARKSRNKRQNKKYSFAGDSKCAKCASCQALLQEMMGSKKLSSELSTE